MKPAQIIAAGSERLALKGSERLEIMAEDLSPEFHALCDDLDATQVAFLLAFAEKARKQPAAEMAGVSKQMHWYWLNTKEKDGNPRFPVYIQAWEYVQQLTLERFEDILADRVENGMKEETWKLRKEKGKPALDPETEEPIYDLDTIRTRHDPNLLQRQLQALDRAKYGNRDQSGGNVTVVVRFRDE